MSILVTGASGVVGKDLINLLSTKYFVIATYRSKKPYFKKNKNIKLLKMNLKKKFSKLKPTPNFIVHCAVDQNTPKNEKKKYIGSNLKLTKNLIYFAKKNKVRLFINFSSIEIYGQVKKNVLTESYKPSKPNSYGSFKLISERLLEKSKINYVNLRLPGILCSNTNINRPWLNLIFRKLKKNENIKVQNLNSNFNSTTSSKVIADFINFLIIKNIDIKETFNFVSKNPIKMKKILNYAKIKLKSKSKIFKDNNTLKKSYLVSYKKLSKKLKFEIPSTKKIIVNHVSNFT